MLNFFRRRMATAGLPLSSLLIAGLAFTAANSLAKPALAAEKPPSGALVGYIDTHNHLFGQAPSPSGFLEEDYDGAARVALAAMDKLGIRKMLIMPPPFTPDQGHRYEADVFAGIVRRYPGRFGFLAGGGTLNVMIQEAVRDGKVSPELRERFEKKALELLSMGALGFGEMTALHFSFAPRHPFEWAPPDHPLFLLLADIAARHDVPIDIHMEAVPEKMPLPRGRRLRSPPNPRVLSSNIAAFERLLKHNRKAKIIWAHAGWDNTGRRSPELSRELLEKHPNLYMSIKVSRDSLPRNRPLIDRGRRLNPDWLKVIRAFPDRFLIGSDQFYASPRTRRRSPRSVEATNRFLTLLPPELARKVGYENPLRIFKLKE